MSATDAHELGVITPTNCTVIPKSPTQPSPAITKVGLIFANSASPSTAKTCGEGTESVVCD
ncbi:hypothetical protein SERLA73DRAFT_68028 [Serpula lacrymans var. lacrymans S7.3]|uniref:Uncharacterized protein n=1 Tax=Serpula lacrymans var. lacrymans (strain S7.3) TaxID=936435 RepID=F8PG83_SERL3|nr:hypothetical protein SERLA73DRAFT_68028 [Serpula lacrymans var. lacrymans S7.3]